MTIEEKITELQAQAQELNTQLQTNDQQRQQITTELIKKVGALEALQSLVEPVPANELAN